MLSYSILKFEYLRLCWCYYCGQAALFGAEKYS